MKHISVTKTEWDIQYKNNKWDYLSTLEETSRYCVISGYILQLDCKKILDLGCGCGLLYNYLYKNQLELYTGVDISNVAIMQSKNLNSKTVQFFEEDIAIFKPGESYDIIICNEVLYYLEDPQYIISRYLNFLRKHGRILISIYTPLDHKHFGYKIAVQLKEIVYAMDIIIEENISIVNRTKKKRWEIILAKPK